MKIVFTIILSFCALYLYAQQPIDYSVQTWAEIDATNETITLHWIPINGSTSYKLFRKLKEGTYWGNPLAILDGNVYSYLDSEIEIGKSYEYKIEKNGGVVGFGYINSGINIAPSHSKGKILLLIDEAFIDGLAQEISQLKNDLIGDGWKVITQPINRESTVASTKQIVIESYNENNIDAIYCLGHIPVPYSSDYAPDGHNNHMGAWPADGYYAEIDGTWTDITANNTTASQERNHNIPGDGKFDQLNFPSPVELQIGRVDFHSMYAFELSEEELLRQYLNKSHAYKNGEIKVKNQAIIDDNFGGFGGEAFAGSAYKSFGPLVHPDNVMTGDFRTSMSEDSYMWSYGCGGGSFTSCNGVAKTSELATDSLQGIFSTMFGSYFGDWDATNNLMRATLAQGTILTNCWSGRPHWYFHHMGLGENIGYSTKISMNYTGTFYNTPLSFLGGTVSMGLMGDPSLRMYMTDPISELSLISNQTDINLSWTASTSDNINGYYIYRSAGDSNNFKLLNDQPILTTTYTDICIPESGIYYYMVRATNLEETPSGSFQNLSIGKFSSVDVNIDQLSADFSINLIENMISTSNSSLNSDTWLWDFGDGNLSTEFEPTHTYSSNGTYLVSMIAMNLCYADTFTTEIIVDITSVLDYTLQTQYKISPNPGREHFSLSSSSNFEDTKINILNINGKSVKKRFINSQAKEITILMNEFPSGMYIVQISTDQMTRSIRVVIK